MCDFMSVKLRHHRAKKIRGLILHLLSFGSAKEFTYRLVVVASRKYAKEIRVSFVKV